MKSTIKETTLTTNIVFHTETTRSYRLLLLKMILNICHVKSVHRYCAGTVPLLLIKSNNEFLTTVKQTNASANSLIHGAFSPLIHHILPRRFPEPLLWFPAILTQVLGTYKALTLFYFDDWGIYHVLSTFWMKSASPLKSVPLLVIWSDRLIFNTRCHSMLQESCGYPQRGSNHSLIRNFALPN